MLRVPVGTVIKDADTGELIADLAKDGERALLAQGGKGGLGNLHFKSSINRAPRQFTRGEPGESAQPRARAARARRRRPARHAERRQVHASSARFRRRARRSPTIPFTTLQPNLGVVRVDDDRASWSPTSRA